MVVSAGGTCCSTHDVEVDSKGKVLATNGGCSALQPLAAWDPAVGGEAAIANWWPNGNRKGSSWIAFAGDSETRYEFWRLVKMLGRSEYTVSDNFARVAYNVSANKAKVEKDQDPVTVEAKYMDYKFCCSNPSTPSTCR